MGGSKKTTGPEGAPEPNRVETYSGFRLHECPRHFTFQGERLEVTRVLARWQEPESLVFIVAAHNSRRYFLKYHEPRDAWEIRIWTKSEPAPE